MCAKPPSRCEDLDYESFSAPSVFRALNESAITHIDMSARRNEHPVATVA